MSKNTTKQNLLLSGIQLFAEHGFDGTSTRMIADVSKTNIASIAFHFGNKEEFYKAVLSYVAELIRDDYRPFWDQVKDLHKDHTPTPQEAWHMIETYVDQLISILTNTNTSHVYGNEYFLLLLFREQMRPTADGEYPITSVLCGEGEGVLELLLMDYWQIKDKNLTAIVSHIISGAVISFGEYPIFIRRILGIPDNEPLGNDVWAFLRSFILNSIQKYSPS